MQALALLICHRPNNLEGASVYIPKGLWRLGIEDIKDTGICLQSQSPEGDGWYDFNVLNDKLEFSSEGEPFRIRIAQPGTEKHITVMAYSCH